MSGEDVDVRVVATDETAEGMRSASEHVRESAKEMRESFEAVQESIKSVGELLGVAFTVDALKEVAERAYETAEQIGHLTQSLGITAEMAQTMSFAAGMVGANLDTASMAMTRLERSAEQGAAGSAQQAEAFRAIGISADELAKLLKNPDELLQTVAKDVNQFQDGAAKTAVVIELLGRNAAQMIPFLKEFGGNLEEAQAQARALGVILSEEDTKALVQTQDALNLASEAAKGLANQFAVAMAPAFREAAAAFTELVGSPAAHAFFKTLGDDVAQVIAIGSQIKAMIVDMIARFNEAFPSVGKAFKDLFDGMGGDVVSFIQEANDNIAIFVHNVNAAWYLMEAGAEVVWTTIENTFRGMIKGVLDTLAQVAEFEQSLYSKVGLSSLATQVQDVATNLRNMSAGFKDLAPDLDKTNQKLAENDQQLKDVLQQDAEWAARTRDQAAALKQTHSELESGGDKILNYNAKVAAGKDMVAAFAKEEVAMATQLDALSSGLQGPYAQAWDQYSKAFDKAEQFIATANLLYKEGKISIEEYNADIAIGLALEDQLALKYNEATSKIQQQHDQFAKLDDELKVQLTLLQTLPNDQAAVTAGLKAYEAALKANVDLYGQAIEEGKNIKDVLDAQLPSWIAAKQHVDDVSEAVKAQNQVFKDWEGIATKALDDTFSTINKDIIEGGSVMKDLVNVAKQVVEAILLEFEKLAIINPLLQAIFGSGVVGNLPTLGSAGGVVGALMGNGSGLGNLFSIFGSGGNNAISTIGGWLGLGGGASAADLGGAGVMAGYGSSDAFAGASASGSLSGGWAGTDWAGSAGSSAAAGGGGFSLGGLAPMFAGALGGYQLGGFGGAALGAAASYFIPVVGWALGAASLINSLTGGGLFGTSWKPTGTTTTDINVGQGGVNIEDWINESRKGSLFSGTQWRNVQGSVPQTQQDAFNQAFAQEQTSIAAAAKALGETVSNEITGSWSAITDKTGKVVSQTSEVMGQNYTEDATHFFERLTALNEISLLPASDSMTKFVDQFQSNADSLKGAADMLVTAQVDINKGLSLIAGDSNLGDIGSLVQSLQQGNESLVQTYVRLQTETQSFKDEMDMIGMHINATGADFVKFADAASAAAGGIDKLDNELTALYQAYTPVAQQQANALAAAKTATQNALSAIGENPNESMAQFWADFQAAMPNLSPDDLQKWITAGLDLASFTTAVTNSATALANAQQQWADYQVQMYGDAFVSATAAAVEWEKKQIDTANQLAQAAGQAGASQQVLAEIMTQGSAMMGKAVADLTTSIYADINTLYSVLMPRSGNAYNDFGLNVGHMNPSTGPDAASQKAAQQQSTAYDLILKLGDLAYAEGKSTSDILKQFNLTPQELAQLLGVSPDQVNKDIQAQSDSDKAMLTQVAQGAEMIGLLQDLVDVARGQPLSYDYTGLGNPLSTSDTLAGGPQKIGSGHVISGPKTGGQSVSAPDSAGTVQPIVDATTTGSNNVVDAINRLAAAQQAVADAIDRAFRSARADLGPRNTSGHTVMQP